MDKNVDADKFAVVVDYLSDRSYLLNNYFVDIFDVVLVVIAQVLFDRKINKFYFKILVQSLIEI